MDKHIINRLPSRYTMFPSVAGVMIIALSFLFVIPALATAEVPEVARQPYRVIIETADGYRTEHTNSSAYQVSPDGGRVAFLRSLEEPVLDAIGVDMNRSIWIVDMSGENLRCLVPAHEHADIYGIRFSPDGRQLYFQAFGGMGGSALHVIDLDTGGSRYLMNGDLVHIVSNGPYASHLLVSQRRPTPMGGYTYGTWLFLPDGQGDGTLIEMSHQDGGGVPGFLEMYEEGNE